MGIGKKIEQEIKYQNISLKELSKKSGISYNTLYAIIKRDNATIKPDILLKISKALAVDANSLLDWRDYKDQLQQVAEVWNNITPEQRDQQNLVSYFSRLNQEGQKKVLDYALDLTLIKKYNKEK